MPDLVNTTSETVFVTEFCAEVRFVLIGPRSNQDHMKSACPGGIILTTALIWNCRESGISAGGGCWGSYICSQVFLERKDFGAEKGNRAIRIHARRGSLVYVIENFN